MKPWLHVITAGEKNPTASRWIVEKNALNYKHMLVRCTFHSVRRSIKLDRIEWEEYWIQIHGDWEHFLFLSTISMHKWTERWRIQRFRIRHTNGKFTKCKLNLNRLWDGLNDEGCLRMSSELMRAVNEEPQFLVTQGLTGNGLWRGTRVLNG